MAARYLLAWNKWNREHIKKHQVTIAEVEEAYQSKTTKKQSYKNRILIFGKTAKGRLLTIVISKERQQDPYVVSARDMSQKERRCYHESAKTH